jgi:hypothetical protein
MKTFSSDPLDTGPWTLTDSLQWRKQWEMNIRFGVWNTKRLDMSETLRAVGRESAEQNLILWMYRRLDVTKVALKQYYAIFYTSSKNNISCGQCFSFMCRLYHQLSGLESREYGRVDPLLWPRDIRLSAKVGTNFSDKRRSLGRYSSLANSAHGVRSVSGRMSHGAVDVALLWSHVPQLRMNVAVSSRS